MHDEYSRAIALDETADVLQDVGPTVEEQFVARVREIYCMCYRQYRGDPHYGRSPIPKWDGGETADGSRHRSVWPKVATAIIDCEADPFGYIIAQFEAPQGGRAPRPNTLYNETARFRWEKYKTHIKEQIERKVSSDLNQVRVRLLPLVVNLHWPAKKAVDYVLRDRSSGVSPLVRYCVAVLEKLPIAAQLRERALVQYFVQASLYDAVMGEKIPHELRVEGHQLRDRLSVK